MAPSRRFKTNRICFTFNKYTEEQCIELTRLLNSYQNHLVYAIVGKEVAPTTGTLHLQGYIRLSPSFLLAANGTILKWKSLFPVLKTAHLEPAYGSDEDSKKYCSKEGHVVFEYGTPDITKGSNPFADILQCRTMEEITAIDPQFAARSYFQALAITRNNSLHSTRPQSPPFLKPWQLSVLKKLAYQNRRQVTFVVDEQGNSGKSVLAHFIAGQLDPKEVFYCRGGKSADIVHAFSKVAFSCKYVIFDYARNKQPDFFAWDLIEELKDGGITSLKYDGNCFWVSQPIKVLVLTNHNLDSHRHRLTEDRWDVIRLHDASKEPVCVDPKQEPDATFLSAFNLHVPAVQDTTEVEERISQELMEMSEEELNSLDDIINELINKN